MIRKGVLCVMCITPAAAHKAATAAATVTREEHAAIAMHHTLMHMYWQVGRTLHHLHQGMLGQGQGMLGAVVDV